jgi:hypothetical protein
MTITTINATGISSTLCTYREGNVCLSTGALRKDFTYITKQA